MRRKPNFTDKLKQLMGFFILSMLSAMLPEIASAKSQGPIVVTIKPLYSLVAQLSEGIEKPLLLMKQMQSPHHYNMRPSERRLLSDARMIIWLGPQMESYLAKIIQQRAIQQQQVTIVTAIQADDLRLLQRRTKNDKQHSAGHSEDSKLDPHIWLSSHNAIAISKHIQRQLILDKPEHTAIYQANLQKLVARITRLSNEIKADLKHSQQPFISYHDALQYFEHENGLNHIASISYDEDAGTSLKQLRYINKTIEKNSIRCLVYQPPKPDIIKTLQNPAIKTTALDPLGLTITDEKEAWFSIMRTIALNFKHCLKP